VITRITEINTKQDMSRWTRAHEKVPGIPWSVFAGPGGTMIIVEHEEDRASLRESNVSPDALVGLGTGCAPRVEEGLFDRVGGERAGGGVGGRGFGGAAEAA
jgi:hypothetical protein